MIACGGESIKESQKTSYKYEYETVEGDALNTFIYTLDNGLKVYMSVFTAILEYRLILL